MQFLADGETMLSLGKDNRLLTWQVKEIGRPFQYQGPPLLPEIVAAAIDKINFDDAWTTFVCGQIARQRPDDALAIIRQKIKAVVPLDAVQLQTLVAKYSDKDINVRKQAARVVGDNIDQVLAALPERSDGRRALDARLPNESQLRSVQPAVIRRQVQAAADDLVLLRQAHQLVLEIVPGSSFVKASRSAARLTQTGAVP